jgi:hypothetical protein
LGTAAQVALVEIIGYVMPFFGLELLDMTRDVAGLWPAMGGNGMPRRAEEPRRRPALFLRCRARGLSHGATPADDLGFRSPCHDWCSRVRVPGAEGLDLDHAYKAMAWLGEVDAPRHCGSKAPVAKASANTAIPKTTVDI